MVASVFVRPPPPKTRSTYCTQTNELVRVSINRWGFVLLRGFGGPVTTFVCLPIAADEWYFSIYTMTSSLANFHFANRIPAACTPHLQNMQHAFRKPASAIHIDCSHTHTVYTVQVKPIFRCIEFQHANSCITKEVCSFVQSITGAAHTHTQMQ